MKTEGFLLGKSPPLCVTLPCFPPRVSVLLCVLRCLVPPSCVCLSSCVCYVASFSPRVSVCLVCVCYVASFPPRVSVCLVCVCYVASFLPRVSVCLVCVCYVDSFLCCVSACVVCVCVRIHNYVTQTVLALNP